MSVSETAPTNPADPRDALIAFLARRRDAWQECADRNRGLGWPEHADVVAFPSQFSNDLSKALEMVSRPSVSNQTPDDGDPFEIRSHAYRRANVCYECGQNPAAHASDQTPATPDDSHGVRRLIVHPAVWDGIVRFLDVRGMEVTSYGNVGGVPTFGMGIKSLDVPGLAVDCTADEAACVHGQTADLTGLAARENGSDR